MAERALIDITQIKSTSNYAALFKKYTDRTEQDDNTFIAIYYKKLKDSIKDKLIQYKIDFRNLKDFIRIFIKLNNKIFF